MSGKGGVGKSFVAAGLASALQRKTGAAGILDGDITGASIPRVMGVALGARVDSEGHLLPGTSSIGLKVASMSLMMPSETKAVIWRGPLISRAITQLFEDTFWGDLDYLVVDMPPGTSDAALTVLESIKPDGIVVVTTPQDMVTNVARRSHDMALTMGTNVLGVVMNMAYVQCPHCDERIDVFGAVDDEALAGLDRLLTLPLVPEWASLEDAGRAAEVAVDAFDSLAVEVIGRLGEG